MEKKHIDWKKSVPDWISYLVLGTGLILALVLFFGHSEMIKQSITARVARHRAARERLLENPEAIESWMTFDYLDKIFSMPPEYLKSKLSISDSQYPRMTIHSYAKKEDIAENEFLASVRKAVRSFKK